MNQCKNYRLFILNMMISRIRTSLKIIIKRKMIKKWFAVGIVSTCQGYEKPILAGYDLWGMFHIKTLLMKNLA